MPLTKSSSPAAFKSNLKAELAANKPKRQALAIAYAVQRRAKMAAGGKIDTPFYARSGARSLERAGMIHSPVGGRTDALPANVKAGTFIMPADAVSGIGHGNSNAGANALNRLFKMGPGGAAMPHPSGAGGMKMPTAGMMKGRKGFADGGIPMMDGAPPDPGAAPPVDIMTAGGEFVVPPDRVAMIGGGDLEKGHAILDAMVQHIRKQTIKTLKRLPKPKK